MMKNLNKSKAILIGILAALMIACSAFALLISNETTRINAAEESTEITYPYVHLNELPDTFVIDSTYNEAAFNNIENQFIRNKSTIQDFAGSEPMVLNNNHLAEFVLIADDLRPTKEEADLADEAEAAGGTYTYTRELSASYKGGSSNKIQVKVKWAKPAATMKLKGWSWALPAGQAVPADAFTIHLSYPDGENTDVVANSKELKYLYDDGNGNFTEENGTLQVKDKGVRVVYEEGNMSSYVDIIFEDIGIVITEATISAPLYSKDVNEISAQYNANNQTFKFLKYKNVGVEIDKSLTTDGLSTSIVGEEVTVTVKDAGTYTIAFRAQDGYMFNETSALADIKLEAGLDGVSEVQKVFIYTITITKAILTSASFSLSDIGEIDINKTTNPVSWVYNGGTDTHAPISELSEIKVKSDTKESISLSTAGPKVDGAVTAAVVSFSYTGTPNSGSQWTAGSTMPTDGGSYTAHISITNMRNYEDFNSAIDTGSMAFNINRASVELPTIGEGQDLVMYTGEKITPDVIPETSEVIPNTNVSVWTVLNDGGTNAGDYQVIFTLSQPYNYIWEGKEVGATYSIDWTILPADNSFKNISVGNGSYNSQTIALTFDVAFGEKTDAKVTWTYMPYSATDQVYRTYEGGDPRVANEENPHPAGWYKATIVMPAQANELGANYKEVTLSIGDSIEYPPLQILRAEIAKPSLSNSNADFNFTYNGNEQKPDLTKLAGYGTDAGAIVTAYLLDASKTNDESATGAGAYTINFVLTDNYRWQGEESTSTNRTCAAEWKIKRAIATAPTLSDGGTTTYAANGNSVTITGESYITGYIAGGGSEGKLSITAGNTNNIATIEPIASTDGIVVGTYKIVANIDENHCYLAADQENFTKTCTIDLTWTINRQAIDKVTLTGGNKGYNADGKYYTEYVATEDGNVATINGYLADAMSPKGGSVANTTSNYKLDTSKGATITAQGNASGVIAYTQALNKW